MCCVIGYLECCELLFVNSDFNEKRILGGKVSCYIIEGLNKDVNLKYIVR